MPMPTAECPQPCQVPLTESLRRVPAQARIFIEAATGCGTTSLPVGEFCHEAADELIKLRNLSAYIKKSRRFWRDKASVQSLENERRILRCTTGATPPSSEIASGHNPDKLSGLREPDDQALNELYPSLSKIFDQKGWYGVYLEGRRTQREKVAELIQCYEKTPVDNCSVIQPREIIWNELCRAVGLDDPVPESRAPRTDRPS